MLLRQKWTKNLRQFSGNVVAVGFLLSPYTTEYVGEKADSSATDLRFALGGGSMERVLSRDCSGHSLNAQDVPFLEAGASIEQRYSVVKVAVKAHAIPAKVMAFSDLSGSGGFVKKLFPQVSDSSSDILVFVNPTIGLNLKDFGLDVGILIDGTRRTKRVYPTGLLRLGNPKTGYGTIGVGGNLPLMAGGGYLDVGLGGNIGKPGMDFWGGLGWGPYAGTVFSIKQNIPLSRIFILNLNGLVNFSTRVQYGIGVGGTVRI
jgi:hypothetical protein